MLIVCFSIILWCSYDTHVSLLYGTGTSAGQIEGAWNVDNRTPSILDTTFHRAGRDNADDSCQSYYLWEEDVKNIANLGVQFHRFSISWSRLLPTGLPSQVNPSAVRYYRGLIDGLLAHGIEPTATLIHFDLPQALQDQGGWRNPDFPRWTADYARVVFTLFGDQVRTWFTINEPMFLCYYFETAMFQNPRSFDCVKSILLAHAHVYRMYREEFMHQSGQLSIVNQVFWYEPISDSEEDKQLAELALELAIGLYSEPIYSKDGGWPKFLEEYLRKERNIILPEFTDEEREFVRGTYDFYALNYYTSRVIRRARPGEQIEPWPGSGISELNAVTEIGTGPDWTESTTSGFVAYPKGLRYHLVWLKKQYGDLKFIVAENGFPTSIDPSFDDDYKIRGIQEQLEQLKLSITEDGMNVVAYTYWSLMDSFEFDFGYGARFGLYHVNFTRPDRPRTPRKSAAFYSELTRSVPKSKVGIYRL